MAYSFRKLAALRHTALKVVGAHIAFIQAEAEGQFQPYTRPKKADEKLASQQDILVTKDFLPGSFPTDFGSISKKYAVITRMFNGTTECVRQTHLWQQVRKEIVRGTPDNLLTLAKTIGINITNINCDDAQARLRATVVYPPRPAEEPKEIEEKVLKVA